MTTVASSVFRMVQFPHQGKIVTIDQLTFHSPETLNTNTNTVPVIGQTKPHYEDIGVGLLKYSSIIEVFLEVPSPYATMNMIASSDPWSLLSPSDIETIGDQMPLSLYERFYESIQTLLDSPGQCSHHVASDAYPSPYWLHEKYRFKDYLSLNLPSDKSVMEAMSVDDLAWKYGHHQSSFFPDIQNMEDCLPSMVPTDVTSSSQTPILTHHVLSEGNMGKIKATRPIDISVKPGIVKNIHIGQNYSPEEVTTYIALFKEFRDVFAWSYEEMSGIDPSIFVHEIRTYLDARPIRQKLQPVHPRKTIAIKAEIKELLKVGFIYPVPLTDWVSNVVPIMKKHATIRVCVDYRDLNLACPKDNYPTLFIDKIIDNYAGSAIFSFMDVFSGYNQIEILPSD